MRDICNRIARNSMHISDIFNCCHININGMSNTPNTVLTYDGVCKRMCFSYSPIQKKFETTLITSKPCINQVFRDQSKFKINFSH